MQGLRSSEKTLEDVASDLKWKLEDEKARVKRRDAEIRLLKEEVLALERRAARYEGEIKALGEDVAASTEKARRYEEDIKALEEDIVTLKEDARRHEGDRQALDAENAALRSAAREHEEAVKSWERAVDKAETAAAEERRAALVLKGDMAALQTQNAELQRAYLGAAPIDTVSQTDILRVLDALDAATLDLATQVADCMRCSVSTVEKDDVEKVGPGTRLSLEEALSNVREGRFQPIATVRLAVQAILTWVTSGCVGLWCWLPHQDAVLARIYNNILSTETQETAAKWRVLTRRHGTHSGWDADAIKTDLMDVLNIVLHFAGWYLDPELVNHGQSRRIEDVVRLIEQIRTHIGQDVASSDFTVFAPQAEDTFNAKTMEDVYASRGRQKMGVERVVCTTAVGLLQTRKTGQEGETMVTTVVRKAKVVLKNDLGSLLACECADS